MKKVALALLVLMLAGGQLFAAGSKDTAAASEPVTLRFITFQTGVHPEAAWFEQTIQTFNKEYEGKIFLDVDAINGEAAFWEKLRSDASSGTMPDLFMLGVGDPLTTMSEAGVMMPLDGFFAKDSSLKLSDFDPISIAKYRDKQGRLLEIPYAKALVGIYYNKELFQKAGITSFPKTWDEFYKTCDTLKAKGITPLSLMTGENAWTTMLLMASYMGTKPGGVAWLTTDKDKQNYNDPLFIDGIRFVQRILQNYTTADAVGAGYGIAANHFLQGETAMIANGPWMVGSFSDPKSAPAGFDAKVAYAPYPGDGVLAWENVGFASGSTDPAKQAASWEVLKFLVREDIYSKYLSVGGAGPTVKVNLNLVSYPRIIQEFTPAGVAAKYKYPIIQDAMKPANSDAMAQYLPDLVSGKLTPEQFAEQFQKIHQSN